jgi:hypothetical protein
MKTINLVKYSSLSTLLLTLVACAGGGGGGGGSSAGGVVITPFTSWSAIQPNSTVQATGGSVGANYTANPVTGQVVSVTTPSQATTGATATFTYGPTTNLTGIAIQSAQGSTAVLNTNAGDTFTINGAIGYGVNKAGTTTLLAPSNTYFGWNYQTYGVWVTGQGTGSGSVGAASVGSVTPTTGIPATGTGSFTGNSIGMYVNSSGQAFYTAATMTANANFSTQAVAFNTTGTTTVNLATGVSASAPTLNLASNMTNSGGTIAGTITSGSGMSGAATGKFYGPTAQEIGGTYALTGGGSSMFGGFGGKR